MTRIVQHPEAVGVCGVLFVHGVRRLYQLVGKLVGRLPLGERGGGMNGESEPTEERDELRLAPGYQIGAWEEVER